VGINTATPAAEYVLDVNGALRSTGAIFSANVGVGTVSPAEKLHLSSGTIRIDGDVPTAVQISNTNPRINMVATTGTNPNYMTLTNTGGVTYMGLENSAASEFGGGVVAYSSIFGSGASKPVHFLTTALPRMTISASGLVGVGTITPSDKVEIASGTIRMAGSGAPSTGGALCLNAAGQMSKCTTVVDASGNCTCP
jgi:hypothetical protein